jgi:hypothetical protein
MTTIERHHQFAKHLAFGEHGLLRSNDPPDQEKAFVYNELVANAVVSQTVVDQPRRFMRSAPRVWRFAMAIWHF